MEVRDVFICHAGPDKSAYVRPFVESLRDHGITYWFDEAEIRWGASIISKVNDGLKRSRFVIVFLSPNFLQRNFPEAELNNALSREIKTGSVVVLPILIASDTEVFEKYPLLSSKLYIHWNEGVSVITERLLALLERSYKTNWSWIYPAGHIGQVWFRICPSPDHRAMEHECTLRWGPWQYDINVEFDTPSISLIHSKSHDGQPVPISLLVTPAAYVTFGTNDPPDRNVLDINHGWQNV